LEPDSINAPTWIDQWQCCRALRFTRKNAAECEREADRATTPALKTKYEEIAQQWREMAEQIKPSAMPVLTERRSN
jgi:hypothetical protein